MDDLFFVLLFFIPAGIANVVPILAAKVPLLSKWNTPVDFGLRINGCRVLGDHKTWRGLLIGVVLGTLVPLSLAYLVMDRDEMFFEIALIMIAVISLAQSIGALMGDLLKSFVKRRMNIGSGKSFLVFDQIDYILGAIIAVYWIWPLTIVQMFYAIYAWGGISLLASYIGFLTRFKSEPI